MFVETEDIWERRYDRRVKPDATPIVIMLPFGPINYVFDYADTYGDQIPRNMKYTFKISKPDPLTGKILPTLVYVLIQLGIYYGEKDYGSRMGGQVEFLERPIKVRTFDGKKQVTTNSHYTIIVNKNLSDNEKAATILHKVDHTLCGHLPVDKENQRLRVMDRSNDHLSKEQEEFEAEKVCELVCKTLGLAYDDEHYLKGYLINGTEPYFSVRVVVEVADKIMKSLLSTI